MKSQFIILMACVVASFALIDNHSDDVVEETNRQVVGEMIGSEPTTEEYGSILTKRQQNDKRRLWFKQIEDSRISELNQRQRRVELYPIHHLLNKSRVDPVVREKTITSPTTFGDNARIKYHNFRKHRTTTTTTSTTTPTTSVESLSEFEE